MSLSSFDHIEEAKRVEDGMIAAEVGCMLLMTLTLIEVVFLVISMGNEVRKRSNRYFFDRFTDIIEYLL